MKFKDLNTRAKEKARNWWRSMPGDDGWWEPIYANAACAATALGFTIWNRTAGRTRAGKSIETPAIYFDLAYSHGDGACWSGMMELSKMADAVERVKAEYPTDEGIHSIAAECECVYTQLTAIKIADRLGDPDDMQWPDESDVLHIKGNGSSHFEAPGDLPNGMDIVINKLANSFGSWIYDQLRAEDEHLNEDTTIDEALDDYDFDEDGNVE